jgi:predicted transcriptional regulator YdeE
VLNEHLPNYQAELPERVHFGRRSSNLMSRSTRPALIALLCTGALVALSSASAYAKDGAPSPQAAPPAPTAAAPSTPTAPAGPKVEKQESFFVIGMTVHTTGDAEAKGDGQIPALWQRFLGEGTNAIPGKVDDDFYAIYSDYGADQSFSYTLGAKVTSIDHVPAGMVAITVPAGRYAVVTSSTGPLQEVVPALWQKIWTMTPAELGGKRSLKFDYDIFNMQGIDPQNAQVDAYVGLQ